MPANEYNVTDSEIRLMLRTAREENDRATAAVCVCALYLVGLHDTLDTLPPSSAALIEEQRDYLLTHGIVPEHVNASECARIECTRLLSL
jgi:hypothetical protein